MSQIIACKSAKGIVLAGDSRSWSFQPGGRMQEVKVGRLLQLSRNAGMLAGGMAEGVNICTALKRFIQEEGLENVDEIYNAALPFLGSEYEKFMRKECEMLPLDPIHNIYFILGGYTGDESDPFRLYLIWTKKKMPQLDGDEISNAYTIPRRMGLEYKLNLLCREDASVQTVSDEIKTAMENYGESQEEVGPPFVYARITENGFQTIG